MQHPSPEIKHLYNQALAYQEQGDVYNTVKLFKRITKLAPQWPLPFIHLSTIYKYRKDWKAALHFTKKAVALDPSYRTGWWNMGIAATALKKPRVAKRVWNKFGLQANQSPHPNPIGIKLEYDNQFEIIWAKAVDPAKAFIASIPHPASDRRFQDILVYDEKHVGLNIANGKKHKVFEELDLLKRSIYGTFSAQISSSDPQTIQLLERLCLEAKLGFENWSNTARSLSTSDKKEFYGTDILPNQHSTTQVAIAAKREEDVKQVLQSWSVISLNQYTDLVQHL